MKGEVCLSKNFLSVLKNGRSPEMTVSILCVLPETCLDLTLTAVSFFLKLGEIWGKNVNSITGLGGQRWQPPKKKKNWKRFFSISVLFREKSLLPEKSSEEQHFCSGSFVSNKTVPEKHSGTQVDLHKLDFYSLFGALCDAVCGATGNLQR